MAAVQRDWREGRPDGWVAPPAWGLGIAWPFGLVLLQSVTGGPVPADALRLLRVCRQERASHVPAGACNPYVGAASSPCQLCALLCPPWMLPRSGEPD